MWLYWSVSSVACVRKDLKQASRTTHQGLLLPLAAVWAMLHRKLAQGTLRGSSGGPGRNQPGRSGPLTLKMFIDVQGRLR